jgi:arylsulfatase A-like enzyme
MTIRLRRECGRRPFHGIALLLAFLPISHATRSKGAPPARPNILVILADDLGYSDLGCYGGEIATPNLDRLAAGGLRYAQFYNTGRCWPSRAALLTGYYAQQVNRDPAGTRPEWAALLPDLLRHAGYRSYHSGKWHVDGPVLGGGFEHSYLVVDQDRHFGPHNHQLDDKPLPTPRPDEGYYATIAIADHALKWLATHQDGHRGEPFFLYLAFTAPHFPIQALPADIARYRNRYRNGWDAVRAERWKKLRKLELADCDLPSPEPDVVPSWNLSENELQRRIGLMESAHAMPWNTLTADQQSFQAAKMAVHAAMVDRIDREVGRVVDRLGSDGLLDNTLILFASDNGASAEQIIRGDGHSPDAEPGSARSFLGLGPGWSTVSNTPFRRHKSWVHEGGVATPLIVHWPAGITARGSIRHAPGHLVDVVPTLLELAGATAPPTWRGVPRPPLAGRSLVSSFNQDLPVARDFLYFHHIGNRALRVGDWKIVAAGAGSPWELYDLAHDRGETTDLARRQPDKVQKLGRLWQQRDAEYAAQGRPGTPRPARPIPNRQP